jgi:hypothetical protein
LKTPSMVHEIAGKASAKSSEVLSAMPGGHRRLEGAKVLLGWRPTMTTE